MYAFFHFHELKDSRVQDWLGLNDEKYKTKKTYNHTLDKYRQLDHIVKKSAIKSFFSYKLEFIWVNLSQQMNGWSINTHTQ